MKRYRVDFARGMGEDVIELEEYIALNTTERTAAKYIDGLVAECESFWRFPYRGSRRRELRTNMRIIGYKHAVTILFRIEEDQQLVVFLGISYRGRSIARILERNE